MIELLVVICIIGILAAILFPVFSTAREKARQVRCAGDANNTNGGASIASTASNGASGNSDGGELYQNNGPCGAAFQTGVMASRVTYTDEQGTGVHTGGSNFAFADSHVKWLPGSMVSTGNTASGTCAQDACKKAFVGAWLGGSQASNNAAGTGISTYSGTFSYL